MWDVRGDLGIPEMWGIGTHDLRALEDLRKKEVALARKRRGRSPSLRCVVSMRGPSAILGSEVCSLIELTGQPIQSATTIYHNNMACKMWTRNSHHHCRQKHMQ